MEDPQGAPPEMLSVRPVEKTATAMGLADIWGDEHCESSSDSDEQGVAVVSDSASAGGLDAFVLGGVLSSSQCAALVRASERLNYTFWNANPDAKRDFRSAFTVEVQSEEFAEYVWNRIRPHVTPRVVIAPGDPRWQRDIEGEWVAYGVNPSLVLARYRDGGHFSPHTDGYTIVDFNRRSLYSLLLYLNDCGGGGATRLFAPEDTTALKFALDEGGRFRWDEASVKFSCPARVGTALAFYQDIPHEGEPVAGPNHEK